MIAFTAERRRFERSRFRGGIELSWTGADGKPSTTVGNCVNISVLGLSIETPCEVPVGAQVALRAKTISFLERVTVRHCHRYGPWFRVGLLFPKPVPEPGNALEELGEARESRAQVRR
jgi:hypothetical protein